MTKLLKLDDLKVKKVGQTSRTLAIPRRNRFSRSKYTHVQAEKEEIQRVQHHFRRVKGGLKQNRGTKLNRSIRRILYLTRAEERN